MAKEENKKQTKDMVFTMIDGTEISIDLNTPSAKDILNKSIIPQLEDKNVDYIWIKYKEHTEYISKRNIVIFTINVDFEPKNEAKIN